MPELHDLLNEVPPHPHCHLTVRSSPHPQADWSLAERREVKGQWLAFREERRQGQQEQNWLSDMRWANIFFVGKLKSPG
jgi:hypothetical protein